MQLSHGLELALHGPSSSITINQDQARQRERKAGNTSSSIKNRRHTIPARKPPPMQIEIQTRKQTKTHTLLKSRIFARREQSINTQKENQNLDAVGGESSRPPKEKGGENDYQEADKRIERQPLLKKGPRKFPVWAKYLS